MKKFTSFLRKARIVAVLAAFIALQLSPLSVAAAGYLTLSSFSGTPGKTITVSGGGLPAGDHVRIYVGSVSGSPVTTSTVGADTNFSADVVIPGNSAQGSLSIFGVDDTNTQLSNSYYVVPLTPSIVVNAPSHSPFAQATVNGSGFIGGESITLELAGATSVVTADMNGAFTGATITIPAAPTNLYHLNVTGNTSSARAFDYFYIDALYPSISPSSYYLLPGQTLSFNGSGFAANELIEVREQNTSAVLSTFTANATGGFSNAGGFALSNSYHGSIRTFVLTGTVSHASASTGMTIGDYFASVSPSVYWTLPGGAITFTGSGFGANEIVNVYKGTIPNASITPVATITTDANGAFSGKGAVTAPYDLANGSVTYRFVGASTGATAQTAITLGSFYPTISPSDYYVQGNSKVTVSGSGFAPNEVVTLTVGPNTSTATTDAYGNLSAVVTIPFSASGFATIQATGAASKTTTSVNVTLATFYPSVSPSSYYVFPADSINFVASGFAANETVTITARDGFGTVIGTPTTVTTNSLGKFTSPAMTVPFVTSNTINFSFTGNLSGATAVSQITVGARYAFIGSDNYYVTPGTTVHISGSGYAANETVTVKAGNQTASQTADLTGSITNVAITIPFGSTGFINVTATGNTSKTSALTSISLAPFSPTVSPDTWYAAPGTLVTFTGTGFAPNETVTVTKSSGTQTVTASATGTFKVTSTLPFGGSANKANFSFIGSNTQTATAISISLAQLYPGVITSTYWAQGGSPIVINGSGFGANEGVTITFDGKNGIQNVGTVTADNTGAFTFPTTIPYAVPGNHTFTITGNLSGAVATSPITLAPVYPGVQLGSYAGAPGTAVTFIGGGYLPNEIINITTDRTGSTVVGTFTADANGNFNTAGFTIPADFTEGNLTLTIHGTYSFSTNSIVYYVTGK